LSREEAFLFFSRAFSERKIDEKPLDELDDSVVGALPRPAGSGHRRGRHRGGEQERGDPDGRRDRQRGERPLGPGGERAEAVPGTGTPNSRSGVRACGTGSSG